MATGGKIDCYIDCSTFENAHGLKRISADFIADSPYSYFALKWLRKHKEALAEHGVQTEYVGFQLCRAS